jgi:hypothetical protein
MNGQTINKMWYIHTMGYYSVVKILTHATEWTTVNDLRLSRRS